jgi:hypothetical protein
VTGTLAIDAQAFSVVLIVQAVISRPDINRRPANQPSQGDSGLLLQPFVPAPLIITEFRCRDGMNGLISCNSQPRQPEFSKTRGLRHDFGQPGDTA